MARRPATKQKPQDDQSLVITIGGVEYKADELTANDIAELEDEFDVPIELIDFRRMRPCLFVVWLFRRRHEPDLALEEVGQFTLRDEADAAPPEGGSRPTAKAGSGRTSSGSRGTDGSTT